MNDLFKLGIYSTIFYLSVIMKFPRTVEFREPIAIGNCCPNLEMHRSKNDMPDMVISTKGNSKVFAHRLILGSRFDKVTRRLSGPITRHNTNVNWLVFDHGIIESLVKFAYTGEITVSVENAYQLFLCAWNLGCEFVSTSISQFMVERVDRDNINLIWTLADITHSENTKRGCIAFMSANLDRMMSTGLLNRLDVSTLLGVLRHENKVVSSEEVVICSITNWAKHIEHSKKGRCRISHFSELCSLVDWTKVSHNSILDMLVNEQDQIIRAELVKSIKNVQPQNSKLATHKIFRAEIPKAIVAQHNKTLYAVGWAESGSLYAVVRFQADNPRGSAILGHVEGQACSRTVLFKGVLFVIGGDGAEFRRRVSTFNVVTREKGQVSDLGVGREWGHSVATSSEEIFVCGGENDEETAMTTCEAFHPGRNRWRLLPNLWQGRNDLAVACLPDGRLLATGGWSDDEELSSCELLNTASQSGDWRPVAAMQEARQAHGAVYFEGRVFVAGGWSGRTSCEVFTPPPLNSTTELGQWTRILSKMTRSFYWTMSIVVVSADEMLVFGANKGEGGHGDEGEVERFKKNSMSEVGDFGAWSWTPLPRIGRLRRGYAIGVHSAN